MRRRNAAGSGYDRFDRRPSRHLQLRLHQGPDRNSGSVLDRKKCRTALRRRHLPSVELRSTRKIPVHRTLGNLQGANLKAKDGDLADSTELASASERYEVRDNDGSS